MEVVSIVHGKIALNNKFILVQDFVFETHACHFHITHFPKDFRIPTHLPPIHTYIQ